MTAALIDYGLFLAKTLTLLLGIGLLVVLAVRARKSDQAGADHLEVTHLNDHYRDLAHQLRQASRPDKAYQRSLKAERKADKARAKAQEERARLFVVDFQGDIKATESAALREIISALLLEAQAGDQVLLRLENAGGLVTEHGLAASQLTRLRAKGLRLTVAVDKVAASGGYLMAVVADQIIAAPFAVVGSIGVVAQLPNFHRVLERHGVDYELHTAGDYKRTLTLFGENTDAGREKLRQQLEDTHGLFKDFIHEFRPGLDLDRVATGEYWHGTQALALGLIDAIQTSDDFLLAAAEQTDLYQVSYAVHKRPLERLLAAMTQAARQRLL
ncbi:MAG: protease SohB [Gammaproteobacteria bacterium]|jgi:serine protease SohB|nr:protease SohB [Gammaproteobacteria bacterium]